MANYRLSKKADQDISDLYAYGIVNFGLKQADKYYNGLTERLTAICLNPFQYPELQDVQKNIRRSVYVSHAIYFR